MFWIVLLNNNLRTFWGWFVVKHPINKNSRTQSAWPPKSCVLICGCLLYDIRDKKEWVLVRREVLVSGTFFRSRSLETLYLASILKIIATCDQAIFFFVLVLLPDSTTRHLRVVIYYYRSVSLQWSIASLVKRPFYFWDKDTVEQKPRDAQV